VRRAVERWAGGDVTSAEGEREREGLGREALRARGEGHHPVVVAVVVVVVAAVVKVVVYDALRSSGWRWCTSADR